MARLLSSLPVGAKVVDTATKYNGVPITWVVGGHDHYAQGQTALVSEKIITLKAFDAKEPNNTIADRRNVGNNRYSVSNIRQWLNSDKTSWYSPQHSADAPPNNTNVESGNNDYDTEAGFFTNFSADMRYALIPTALTVAKNNVTDRGGSETVTDKVFLLSNTEVGLANENGIAEGKLLAMFSNRASRVAYPTTEAVTKSEYKDATNLVTSKPWKYGLRTPSASTSYYARYVSTSGSIDRHYAYSGDGGVRPALNIMSTTLVSDIVNANGEYEILPMNIEPQDGTELSGVYDSSLILKYVPSNFPANTTVTEKVNGVVVGTKSVVNGSEYKVSATPSQWDTVKYGGYRDVSGNKNVVTLEVSTGEIYTYPFTKTLPTNAKTDEVVMAVNDMSNTAMPSHKKKLVEAIGDKATVGGTGSLEDIAKAIESISVESMNVMKIATGTFEALGSKASVRGLSFRPKGIVYKSPTYPSGGVYFIKNFHKDVNFSEEVSFGKTSTGGYGISVMTPFDNGFDITVAEEDDETYYYVAFG